LLTDSPRGRSSRGVDSPCGCFRYDPTSAMMFCLTVISTSRLNRSRFQGWSDVPMLMLETVRGLRFRIPCVSTEERAPRRGLLVHR